MSTSKQSQRRSKSKKTQTTAKPMTISLQKTLQCEFQQLLDIVIKIAIEKKNTKIISQNETQIVLDKVYPINQTVRTLSTPFLKLPKQQSYREVIDIDSSKKTFVVKTLVKLAPYNIDFKMEYSSKKRGQQSEMGIKCCVLITGVKTQLARNIIKKVVTDEFRLCRRVEVKRMYGER